ncbi:MAG: SpoIIE family protein phosphatase [Ignavibacteriae bacterium]|nr:SpoIIE family protein phosphatase [Ignavibacteriota bacterium]
MYHIKKNIFGFYLFFLIFSSNIFTFAQTTNPNKVNFSKLSIQDGLSNRQVLSIIQDKYGFMWFGTSDGLNRYDGESIKVYKNDPAIYNSLSNNAVISLFEDSKGILWVATRNGLNRFNREKDSFDNFTISEVNDDMTRNSIVKIEESPNGHIYVATVRDGIQKLNLPSGKFTPVVRDTTDPSGFDLVLSLSFENDSTLSYLHINVGTREQNLIFFNTNTKEKVKYLIPPIERNSRVGDIRGMGVSCGIDDEDGNIWLGTADGRLFLFNREAKSFNKFEIAKGNILISIVEDDSSNFWISSTGSGLIKYNESTNEKTFFKTEHSNPNSLSNNFTLTVYRDRMGIIWVGTVFGVDRFDPFQTPFFTHKNEENNPNSLSDNRVVKILKVKKELNKFWIATRNGLNKFDLDLNESERYFADSTNEFSNSIRTILKSENNNIWVGTSGDGLKLFNPNSKKFSNVLNSPDINPYVHGLVKTNDNNLWLATSSGLVKYNTVSKKVKTFLSKDTTYITEIFSKLSKIRKGNEVISSISKAGDNEDITKKFSIDEKKYALLVTMGENGMANFGNNDAFDYGWVETDAGNRHWTFPEEKTMHVGGVIKNRIVVDVIELEKGNYKLRYTSDNSHSYKGWNSTKPTDGEYWGIQLYKISKNEVDFFKKNLDKKNVGSSVPSNNITTLFSDNSGILWVGTYTNGFATYDITKDKFEVYKADANNINSLIDNRITSFYQDRNGLMWIATQNGLNSFDKKTKTFSAYTEEDGLPTNFISDMLQDQKGNYWISSFKGLSKFLPSQNNSPTTVINYDLADGLQGYEFYPQSKLITSDGQILLGGRNGLNSFYPGNINPYPPEIIVKNFELFNKSVTPGDSGSPLEKAIYSTEEISLSHEQNVFGFEFQAMHFSRPGKNIYSYKMDGVDKDWITGQRNYASYTNLDPGKYIFNVKAANSDGVWNEKGKSIIISISSPWWQTWWAYLSYATLLLFGFVTFDKLRKRKILNKEREKAQIEQAELRATAAEAQSKLMQVENDRKTKELEEARELQLSMLPKELPNLPHLDIAVYMKTATEVGGDYYDFHIGMDGTLTAVIGDATGHGLNAGTVVTATKSLFSTHANNPDILFTFSEMTRVLKGMKLRMLSMCLSILKIKGNQLTISSAGIPPALIYRRTTNEIEEFLIKGMPLGVKNGFPYEVRTTEISPGDTILLMSDGFPELFNKEKEMFGYDKVKNVFGKVTGKEPEEIIEHLKNTGSAWVEDAEPDDDVTFVVIKMR